MHREQVLSRAGLARDQDRRLGCGDSIAEIKDLHDRGRAAEQAAAPTACAGVVLWTRECRLVGRSYSAAPRAGHTSRGRKVRSRAVKAITDEVGDREKQDDQHGLHHGAPPWVSLRQDDIAIARSERRGIPRCIMEGGTNCGADYHKYRSDSVPLQRIRVSFGRDLRHANRVLSANLRHPSDSPIGRSPMLYYSRKCRYRTGVPLRISGPPFAWPVGEVAGRTGTGCLVHTAPHL